MGFAKLASLPITTILFVLTITLRMLGEEYNLYLTVQDRNTPVQ